jgi:hypothetical protein
MNKKILYGIAVLVIAVIAALNVNLGKQKDMLSSVALDNIEALAEESTSYHCNRLCEYWPFTYCVLESSTAYIYCFEKYPK